jgi:thymidylate kinase
MPLTTGDAPVDTFRARRETPRSPMSAALPTPLAIALRLFAALDAAGVRHCHWKSNEHLLAGLAGETDLDLLVDPERSADVDAVLLALGFRRFQSPPRLTFPGVFDWLGFDDDTGRLVHVHLHHRLLTGRRFVKEQGLPWVGAVLDARVRDPATGVYVTHPALELVVLLVRAAFKTRGDTLPAGLVREFDWLYARVDFRDVEVWAHQILSPADAGFALDLLLTRRHGERDALRALHRRVWAALADHRLVSGGAAATRGPLRAAEQTAARVTRKVTGAGRVGKRLVPTGRLVAVIGCDGAGKSTVAAELARWLAWKIDARTVYLGVGEGRVGLKVRALRRLARAAEKQPTEPPGPPRPSPSSAPRPGTMPTRLPFPQLLRDVGSGLLNNAMADERMAKLREAQAFRAAGGILLTDRFPQTQFPGIYDGPRTTRSDHESVVRRAFAAREARLYETMADLAPDLVIKLHVPVEIAVARKPGHNRGAIQRKCDLTVALEFPRSVVVDVDAARPLDEVLLDCKRILWRHL